MFDEFTFLKDRIFDEYFGFTEEEVKSLCDGNKDMDFKELESWYNGYLKIPNKELMKEFEKALRDKCNISEGSNRFDY